MRKVSAGRIIFNRDNSRKDTAADGTLEAKFNCDMEVGEMIIVVIEGELSHALELLQEFEKIKKGQFIWVRERGEAAEDIAQLLKKGAKVISEKHSWLSVTVLDVSDDRT